MKKYPILAVLLIALLLAAVFTGCKKNDTAESKAPDGEASVDPDDFWFTLNGVEIRMDVSFAELSKKLGDEVKPSETIRSCNPDSDWVMIQHFYPGITVMEDKDGSVFGAEMSEFAAAPGDVTLNGVLKLGVSTMEDVRAVLGEPDDSDLGSLFYSRGRYTLALIPDEGGSLLCSVTVTANEG